MSRQQLVLDKPASTFQLAPAVQTSQNVKVTRILGTQWIRGWQVISFIIEHDGVPVEGDSLYSTHFKLEGTAPSPYTLAFLILPRGLHRPMNSYVVIDGKEFNV